MSAEGAILQEKQMTNLEKLLAVNGWSNTDLARYLGITQKSAWNKTTKKTQFKWNEVLKIMDLFPGYSIDYIFDGYGRN